MKSFEKTGPGPVPKLLLWVSVAVLVATGVMLVVGGLRVGVTWDEPYHVERYDNYLQSGWYVIDAQSEDGEPFETVTDQYVYAPATMGFLHLWNMLLGADSSGTVATTAHAYALRHLGISFLAILCLVGVATLGRLVLRRWDWGVVAAAALCATPMWTGHAMFNVKDVPVATGYVWVTVGLCLIARRSAGGIARRAAAVASLAAGSFLMIGTRPGMWTAAFVSTVALLVLVVFRERGGHGGTCVRRHRWRLGELMAGYGAAYLGLLALYPNVFGSPMNAARESATSSANFLGVEASRAFVPIHVVLQTPLLLLFAIGFGVVTALAASIRGRRRSSDAQIRLALVGVQLFALPSVTLVHASALYSDLRQLLFAAPAAAALATVGIATLVERSRRGVDRVPVGFLTGLGVLMVALPVADQATLFPYNYAYYNQVVRIADVDPNLDYYRASPRELVDDLPPVGRVVCSPIHLPDQRLALRVSQLDGARDCRTSAVSPIAAFASNADAVEPRLMSNEFWVIQAGSGRLLPDNCTELRQANRRHIDHLETMSVLLRCRLDYPVLGVRAVMLDDRPDLTWSLIDKGWYLPDFSPDKRGFRAHPEGGTIGFRTVGTMSDAVLVVSTERPVVSKDLRVEVDGNALTVSPRDDNAAGFQVEIPGFAAGLHKVRFLPEPGTEIDLILSGVSIEAE